MELHEILSDLTNRHFDINKVINLEESKRDIVINLFNQLMDELKIDPLNFQHTNQMKIQVLYNTLVESGYLVTRREKNLNNLID